MSRADLAPLPEWAGLPFTFLACTLLVLYLMDRIECNRFVRLMLAVQAGFVMLTFIVLSER